VSGDELPAWSYQQLQVAAGLSLWATMHSQRPLMAIKETLWLLSEESRRRQLSTPLHRLPPHQELHLPAAVVEELRRVPAMARATYPILGPNYPVCQIELTTDACLSGGAAVWHFGPSGQMSDPPVPTQVLKTSLWPWAPDEDRHVNVLEMQALADALRDPVPQVGPRVTLMERRQHGLRSGSRQALHSLPPAWGTPTGGPRHPGGQ
jgi:hypothetical protein